MIPPKNSRCVARIGILGTRLSSVGVDVSFDAPVIANGSVGPASIVRLDVGPISPNVAAYANLR